MDIDIDCKDCTHATKTGYSLTCDLPNEIECDPVRRTIPQESQTAAQVEAATLRKVGEALASLVTETGMPLFIDYKHVDALRQGKMPEGWGK